MGRTTGPCSCLSPLSPSRSLLKSVVWWPLPAQLALLCRPRGLGKEGKHGNLIWSRSQWTG